MENPKEKNFLMERVKMTPLMERVEQLECEKKKVKLMTKVVPLMVRVNAQNDERKDNENILKIGISEINDIRNSKDKMRKFEEISQERKIATPVLRPINSDMAALPETDTTQIISDVGHTYAYVNAEYKEMGNFLIRITEELRKITEVVNAENKVEGQKDC